MPLAQLAQLALALSARSAHLANQQLQPDQVAPHVSPDALRSASSLFSADTPLPKSHYPPLPSIYYINLDNATDRRERLMRQLSQISAVESITRIPATPKLEILQLVDDGNLSLAPGLSVFNESKDYGSTAAAYLHEIGVYLPSEFACTHSHLRAIKRAYDDGLQAALILEDDVSFRHFPDWDATLQELVVGAPADWEVLQLYVDNPDFYSYTTQTTCAGELRLWSEWEHENWSTMAYVINRFGMAKLLSRTVDATFMPRALAADELIYTSTKTYSLTRPLFAAMLHMSTIQTDRSDPNKPVDQVTGTTDGMTDYYVDQFYERRRSTARSNTTLENKAACFPAAANDTSIAVLATASATEMNIKRAIANAEALFAHSHHCRWLYGINSIDNDIAPWINTRDAFASMHVMLLIHPSGRQVPRFQSKFVGQLSLFQQVRRLVRTDFVWLMDDDIAVDPHLVGSLLSQIQTAPHPVIAQPTVAWTPPNESTASATAFINVARHLSRGSATQLSASKYACVPRLVNSTCEVELGQGAAACRTSAMSDDYIARLVMHAVGNAETGQPAASQSYITFDLEGEPPYSSFHPSPFAWGSQYFSWLNENRSSACGSMKTPVPTIESQTPILTTKFLEWYTPTMDKVVQLQQLFGSDYGLDAMWCSAAKRFLEESNLEVGGAHLPCALLETVIVRHEDGKTIDKENVNFWCGSRWLENSLFDMYSSDFQALGLINEWALNTTTCSKLLDQRIPATSSYGDFLRRRRAMLMPTCTYANCTFRFYGEWENVTSSA